jgi:hypothetical protein
MHIIYRYKAYFSPDCRAIYTPMHWIPPLLSSTTRCAASTVGNVIIKILKFVTCLLSLCAECFSSSGPYLKSKMYKNI